MATPTVAAVAAPGYYSALAIDGCGDDTNKGKSALIKSPDGKSQVFSVEDKDGNMLWRLKTQDGEASIDVEAWPCPEFLWSADSKLLAVTYSDGGSVGDYHIIIYSLPHLKPSVTDFGKAAKQDFLEHYPKCYYAQQPNLAAVAWWQLSKGLLIATEVQPVSDCDDMGTFSLYEVTVPDGKIVKKYTQLEAKRLFKDALGAELKNAEDDCILKPGTCYIPDLHKNDQKN